MQDQDQDSATTTLIGGRNNVVIRKVEFWVLPWINSRLVSRGTDGGVQGARRRRRRSSRQIPGTTTERAGPSLRPSVSASCWSTDAENTSHAAHGRRIFAPTDWLRRRRRRVEIYRGWSNRAHGRVLRRFVYLLRCQIERFVYRSSEGADALYGETYVCGTGTVYQLNWSDENAEFT